MNTGFYQSGNPQTIHLQIIYILYLYTGYGNNLYELICLKTKPTNQPYPTRMTLVLNN